MRRAAEGVTMMPKFMPIMRPSDETVTAMSCMPFDEMLEGVGRYNDELPHTRVPHAAERLDPEWATRLARLCGRIDRDPPDHARRRVP